MFIFQINIYEFLRNPRIPSKSARPLNDTKVFGPTLDPSAMALMTDGEIPLTDSTNLLGPNSLMPTITPYFDYGSGAAVASTSRRATAETDLRGESGKKSRHKKNANSCTNSYSNNSFDYSNMERYAVGGYRTPPPSSQGMLRDSFRPGRVRTTSGSQKHHHHITSSQIKPNTLLTTLPTTLLTMSC